MAMEVAYTHPQRHRLRRVADRQSGRVSAAQFGALGIESWLIARWVDCGYLGQTLLRVYAVGHKGLPTTTIEQVMLDFAAVAPPERLRHVLANADYHRVLDTPALQVIAGNGRAGSTKLKNALKRHEPKLAHIRSPLERLFLPLCERAGIPLPEVNVYVGGVLVDAVWREQKLVVELDGEDNHSSWAQIQEDRSKELAPAASMNACRTTHASTSRPVPAATAA
jgi:hypothetical protein